jgi:hypothetical protein
MPGDYVTLPVSGVGSSGVKPASDQIPTDDRTVLDTPAQTTISHPRVKIEFGRDGQVVDVSYDEPLPTTSPDIELRLVQIIDVLTIIARHMGAIVPDY